ncbi:MAG TPA: hypothetical protein ENN99_16110 [Chloroflexi bacterium]|nr:hypothetical protein [Chloroflexota bacterium]
MNAAGPINVDGAAMVISQCTLYADARKGRRPGFTDAAPSEVAEPLVEIHDDGPVTILLER